MCRNSEGTKEKCFFVLVHSIRSLRRKEFKKKRKANNPVWLCPSSVIEVKTKSKFKA